MPKHVKVAAILNIIYYAIALMIAFLLLMFFGIGLLLSDDSGGVVSLVLFVILIVGLPAIILVLGLIGSIGLFQAKEWAWILTIVISSINLLAFPFGTALGIYTLKVMFSREAIVYLARADKKVFVRQDA